MRLRNKKMVALVTASIIALGSLSVGAAQLTKQIQVHYNNIKVAVDGQQKGTTVEPFNYDGSVYVGLRDMGQMLGAKVDWDPSTQTVKIDTSSLGGNAAETEALKKQVNDLKSQLDKANAKIDAYEEELENKIDIVALEKKLVNRYADKYDVEWAFELDGNIDGLDLRVKFDSHENSYNFNRISPDKLETFMQDVCKYLQQEVKNTYQIEGIKVKGELYDVDTRENYAAFEMNSKARFYYEWLKKVTIDQEALKEYEYYMNINYRKFPYVNMGGYDSNSIGIKKIELIEQDGEVVFNIYTNLDDFGRPYWNRLNATDASDLGKFMERLRVELKGKFEVDARGYVYDEYNKEMARYGGVLELD